MAAGIAAQFGSRCEVIVHDLSRHPDHTIVAVENGEVTGRKVGDGASHIVLEELQRQKNHDEAPPQDHLSYLTKTPDGKILKSSSIYIRDDKGEVSAILSINYDISTFIMVEQAVKDLIKTEEPQQSEPEKIVNINDLLDDLIEQSVALVGKPVAMMHKEDKVKAVRFLNENGAFLVTKSSDKIAKFFGISKYTLYSYLDIKQREEKKHEND